MIHPQPIHIALRKDRFRRLERRRIRLGISHQRVEDDRPAVEHIRAHLRDLRRREREGLVTRAIQHRVLRRLRVDLLERFNVRGEVDIHLAAHPFEQPLQVVRRARPIFRIAALDLREQRRRLWRILLLLPLHGHRGIRQRWHPLARRHLRRRRFRDLQRRRLRRFRPGEEECGEDESASCEEGRFHRWRMCAHRQASKPPAAQRDNPRRRAAIARMFHGFEKTARSSIRGAHASRMLVLASRQDELHKAWPTMAFDFTGASRWKVRAGGTPAPTCGTHVLPGTGVQPRSLLDLPPSRS